MSRGTPRVVTTMRSVLIAASAVVLMGACAQSEPEPEVDPTPAVTPYETVEAQPEEPSASPTAAAPTTTAFLEEYSVTDADGYSFDLRISMSIELPQNDPTTQLPGETALFVSTYDSEWQIVNTTPSRELTFAPEPGMTAPQSTPALHLLAVFAPGNPVCVAQDLEDACYYQIAFGRINGPLGPDARLALTTFLGVPNGGATAGISNVPEADAEVVAAALAAPDGYVVAYSGGGRGRFINQCPDAIWNVPVLAMTGAACHDSIQALTQPPPRD